MRLGFVPGMVAQQFCGAGILTVISSLDLDEVRRRCRRTLSLNVRPDPAESLKTLASFAEHLAVPADQYGEGELSRRLETNVCSLLGKEAALFLPSGKMAQMIALRIHAGRAGCARVAMHPRAHFEEYEAHAYQELYNLTAAQWGGYDTVPTAAELLGLMAEPLGAITVEMPLRRLGCRLLPWQELEVIAGAARKGGVALHLDGARLWESQPFYGKPHAEIAGLFDTVYVAFDKGLGALGGGMLAGSSSFIAEGRIWQRRAGGRMLRSFPYQLSALQALDERLPRMRAYHDRAKAIAAVLGPMPGLRVTPSIPEANAFLVTLEGTSGALLQARNDIADEHGTWLFEDIVSLPISGLISFEVTVREGAFALDDNEIEAMVRLLAARAVGE